MPKKKAASASPFVPEDEQPYPIPENWCWTRLKALVETSKEKTDIFLDDNMRYVGLEHIEKDGGIIGYSSATKVKSLKAVFHVGQILYGKLRPYLNKHDVAGFDGVCSTDILVFNARNCAKNRYINYFLDQRNFIEYAVSNSKGINLPRVSESVILEAVCPLPPLSEQHRIVTRIESLFAKLDEAKEKAQAVVDGFELRKSAILHKAFTGELTERWRKEHGVSVDNWQYRKLSNVATVISGYAFSSDNFDECNNIPCIKITNVGVGNYISENYEYLPTKFLDTYNRFKVNSGNILISLTRSYIAAGLKVCICDEPRDSLLNQRVALIKNCNIRYIYYYLRSSAVLYYVKEKSKTTNQPNLSIKDLNNLLVPIPVESEQNEIVSVLNNLLDKEEYVKSTAEAVLSQIDTMKKAILARAFRGELGTNDPAEESAEELIKAVL